MQEALLAAYKHIDQFRGQAQMATWLTAIVRNCALMQLRKRPRQIHLPLDEQTAGEQKYFVSENIADTRPTPEEECRHLELSARVQKCAARLSPTLRRTFQLRVSMGFSIFETARILGIAARNGQGPTGASARKDCAGPATSACTKFAQPPKATPIVLSSLRGTGSRYIRWKFKRSQIRICIVRSLNVELDVGVL